MGNQAKDEYLASIEVYMKKGLSKEDAILLTKSTSLIFPTSWDEAMAELG